MSKAVMLAIKKGNIFGSKMFDLVKIIVTLLFEA